MNINNLRELIKKTANDYNTYSMLVSNIEFLNQERVKIASNRLRSILARPSKDVDKDRIFDSIRSINKISSELNVDFYIEEDWDTIEKFLMLTILEDISKEFEKQTNN